MAQRHSRRRVLLGIGCDSDNVDPCPPSCSSPMESEAQRPETHLRPSSVDPVGDGWAWDLNSKSSERRRLRK